VSRSPSAADLSEKAKASTRSTTSSPSSPDASPDNADAFSQAAYLWAGLHGRVALGDAIPTFPWPSEPEHIERMIQIHITDYTMNKQPRCTPRGP
jgi:hypothetical protein